MLYYMESVFYLYNNISPTSYETQSKVKNRLIEVETLTQSQLSS